MYFFSFFVEPIFSLKTNEVMKTEVILRISFFALNKKRRIFMIIVIKIYSSHTQALL